MWLVGVVFTTPGVSMLLTNQILVMSDRNIRNAFLPLILKTETSLS